MKVKVEINTDELTRLVIQRIAHSFTGIDAEINAEDIKIEVRSKQNYRQQEWERGEFRATMEKDI